MTKDERLAKVSDEAHNRFDAAYSACIAEREEALEDRRFHSIRGAQWEGSYGDQFTNRPKLEANVVGNAVMRVVNEYRNNRITVDFISKEGDEYDELADMCDGLYRADEQDSRAQEAYDNAFEEAVGGGFGAYRLVAEYEDEYDEEDDKQRIRIEPIYDADTCVFFDPSAKRQDKSDARFCFVLQGMTRDAFEAEYNESPTDWGRPNLTGGSNFDWSTPDLVYIAEYYVIEEKRETVFFYKSIDGEEERYTEADFKRDEGLNDKLAAIGTTLSRQKTVKRRRVHKYILSGGGVLEDCGIIAGSEIPVVPVYGKRWYVDGVERFAGAVRYAKDMQRLKNMQISSVADIASRSSVPKPIVTPSQVAGLESYWADDAVQNYAYQMLHPIDDGTGNLVPMGPIGYTQPAQIPQATAALLEISAADIKEVLGSQEAGDQVDTNLSGKAIELVQNRLDMQSYIYMDNFAKAIRRGGAIWLSMASEIYVEPERKMKSVTEDGSTERVTLNRPVIGDDGSLEDAADLSNAKFDVVTDVGPASSSRRSATVRALTSVMGMVADPQDQKIILAGIMRNIEGEGIGGLRDYFRRQLVALGVEDPTDADIQAAQEAAQGQQPDPQTMLTTALAQESAAKGQKAQADAALALARTEESKAKTAETLAGIEIDQRGAVIDAVTKLRSAGTVPPQLVGTR